MNTENIKISVSESGADAKTSVVRVDGVIDTLTAAQLEEVLDKLIKRGRFGIILDLAGVDYISSAGWGIFISRIKEIRDSEGDIKLAGMVPNVFEIYELLEFDNILNAYDSVESARDAFGGNSGDINLKKKAAVTATRTTIEELPFSAQSGLANLNYERTLVSTGRSIGLNAENAVKEAIADDPFCTISELRLILQESMMGTGPNWWGIFKILWRNKLLSRRSRFRFARQRRRRK